MEAETLPELEWSVDLANHEGVKHYDQKVRDQLDEDKLGPEAIIGVVGFAWSKCRLSDDTPLAVIIKFEEPGHIVDNGKQDG